MLLIMQDIRKVGGVLTGHITYQIIAAITGYGQSHHGARGGITTITGGQKDTQQVKNGSRLI